VSNQERFSDVLASIIMAALVVAYSTVTFTSFHIHTPLQSECKIQRLH
jgi:hypothetical protein